MQLLAHLLLVLATLSTLALASSARHPVHHHQRAVLNARMQRLPRSTQKAEDLARRATQWQECWASYAAKQNSAWQNKVMQQLQDGQTPDAAPQLASPESVCGQQPDASGSVSSSSSHSHSAASANTEKEDAKVKVAAAAKPKAQAQPQAQQQQQQQQQQQKQSDNQPKSQSTSSSSSSSSNSNSNSNSGSSSSSSSSSSETYSSNSCTADNGAMNIDQLLSKAPSQLQKVGWAVKAAAKQYSIQPQLLVAMAMTESTGCSDPAAYSNGGGCWQFTDSNAWAQYGPKGKAATDDGSAAFGAANYISALCKQQGGNLYSALRSYNGPLEYGGNPNYQNSIYSFMAGNM